MRFSPAMVFCFHMLETSDLLLLEVALLCAGARMFSVTRGSKVDVL